MASNLLWAHLLRKDATTTDAALQIPPIAPQDKTGTSMRMLIHDTQVNLEKFSTRLDGLLQRVDDCRAQVVNANKLLDVERDKVLSEILEIAHRCKSELKTHVGAPAQASAVDLVHVSQVSTEKSVQALEKRIDALQALIQTHAHAMQSIQDQQNTLIGAVLPLVPILHGIPLQTDQIKTALSDMVADAMSTIANSIENARSTLVAEYGPTQSSTRVGSSSKSISSSRRGQSGVSALGPREINVPVSSPLDGRGHRQVHTSLKRARIEGATHHADDVQLPRKLSRLAVPLGNSGDPPLLRTPKTPRQPLADLPLISGSKTPRIQHYLTSHTGSISSGHMRSCEALLVPAGSSNSDPPASKPLFQLLKQAPFDRLNDQTVTRQRSADLHDMPLATDKFTMTSAAGPSSQDTLSKAIKIEEILELNLTDVFSIHSSPLSSPPSSLPLVPRYDPDESKGKVAQSPVRHYSVPQDYIPDTCENELAQDPPPSSDPLSLNRNTLPLTSMSLRDRRAQISRLRHRETRRFIPLVPWSDEEE